MDTGPCSDADKPSFQRALPCVIISPPERQFRRQEPRPRCRAAAMLALGHVTELSVGKRGPFEGRGSTGTRPCGLGKGAPFSQREQLWVAPGDTLAEGRTHSTCTSVPALWRPLPDVTLHAALPGFSGLWADAPVSVPERVKPPVLASGPGRSCSRDCECFEAKTVTRHHEGHFWLADAWFGLQNTFETSNHSCHVKSGKFHVKLHFSLSI